jgi:hypothetical protein
MCNVFETVDRGIIYVDCTGTEDGSLNNDRIVSIAQNCEYQPVPIDDYYFDLESMGKVRSFGVFW